MLVQSFSGYRVGTDPPYACSLQPGELFVEVDIASGIAPRLWVGTTRGSGFTGNLALIVTGTPPAASTLVVAAVPNPSTSTSVRVTGTAAPGCLLQLAALAGTDVNTLNQLTDWVTFDASAGTFDVTFGRLPPATNVRVRVQMRDRPQTFQDSNLFAVTDPPLARP